MGEDQGGTVNETAEARERIEIDLRELNEDRPDAVDVKKFAMVAGGASVILLLAKASKGRRQRKAAEQLNARLDPIRNLITQDAVSRLKQVPVQQWVVGGFIALRLLELRRLKKIQKSLKNRMI